MFSNKLRRYTPYMIILIIYTVFGVLSYNDFFSNNSYSDTAGSILLKYGSRGTQVKTVQTKLKKWGYYNGGVDGIYGWITRSSVIKFQKKNGLKVDGVVGSATAKALGIFEQAKTTTRGTVTRSNDVNTLAQAVHGEARGEPYIGQVAVAAVILNRVDNPKFPNTIAGVIYQPGAFTAVADGQMFLAPGESATKAAKDALNGWDPSGGAIYYFNPAKATSKWIWSRPVIKIIGKHYFCN
ncbi:MAG: spore cortex-lytic enzyme [Lutisporaceae bacterium]